MSDQVPRRRLAAILAADVVGYSRLMSADEAATLAALKVRRREILQPLVAKHHGRVVKVMGDGVLVEFASAVNAVACSVELQEAMDTANADLPEDRRIVLRVGINLGDVIAEGSDLYGEGVNIAARLEALAEPGSVFISGKVRQEVANKLKLSFDDLGEQNLKNIPEVVRVYRVSASVTTSDEVILRKTVAGSKPTIAVLPFTNMSGDPEQQYFSDGIMEDIITELSRFRSLFVIARNSSFLFRDKAADAKQIGRTLGAAYIVEGSVRRMGPRVRVTAQLIEAATGNHLWAERYDRDLQEIFEVQDEVVRAIVAVLPGRIEEAGAYSARRKRPESLEAYDFLLRGIELAKTFDDASTEPARKMFEEAIAVDAGIAPAYAWLANLRLRDWWTKTRSVSSLDEAFALAKKAVAADGNDGVCNGILGMAYLERRNFDEATFHTERFIALNPNDSSAPLLMGELLAYLGRPDEGITWIERAFRLNPFSPQAYTSFQGMILFAARRYAESIAAFNRMLVGTSIWEVMYLVAGYAYLGQLQEAHTLIAERVTPHPEVSLLAFAAKEPFKQPADLDHLLEGLRIAGISN
jgi:TolB-like protein/class 3 adenylate cyclase